MSARENALVFMGILFLASLPSAAHSASYDWGTTGVSDPSRVTNVLQVTDNQFNDGAPGGDYPRYVYNTPKPWSQNGDWIVYTANINSESSADKEICLIKPDGTQFTQLTANTEEDSNASFGSDGRVYFERYVTSVGYNIFRMDGDGSGESNLTAAHAGSVDERDVLPSPDATKVAYRSNSRLWTADSDGANPVQVSQETPSIVYFYGHYDWSPDSGWLAYRGSSSGYHIFVAQADGTGHTQLTSAASTSDEWPAWSPDGSKIAFERYDYSSTAVYQLIIMDPDGSNQVVLDQADGTGDWTEIRGPISWSPNSQWLAYVKLYNDGMTTDYSALFMVDVATQTTYQLTDMYYDWLPYWSPDGSQLLFMDGRYDISRDNSDNLGVGINNQSDMLLLNLIGDYGSSVVPATVFPWHMFLPAIELNGKK